MTTDKTPATLATAKHGGCVQLGDAVRALPGEWRERAEELIVDDAIGLTHQLKLKDCADELEAAIASMPPSPAIGVTDAMVHAYSKAYDRNWEAQLRAPDDAPELGTFFAMRAGLQAALSAQPSPGGQGDARLLADVDERIATAKALGYEDDIGVGIGLLQCVRAALAARQPVGEPIGHLYRVVVSDAGASHPWAGPGVIYTEGPAPFEGRRRNGQCLNVYARPPAQHPAQAVDLAEFKALYRAYVHLLESGRDRIIDLGGTCDPVDVMEANDVDLQAARRVMDSQAVGNG